MNFFISFIATLILSFISTLEVENNQGIVNIIINKNKEKIIKEEATDNIELSIKLFEIKTDNPAVPPITRTEMN